MSKRTERLAAKAREAAEKAAQDVQTAEDKVAESVAADAEAARSSPADKAVERAFARGTLPEKDRRAPGFEEVPSASPPEVLQAGARAQVTLANEPAVLEVPSASPQAIANEEALLAGGPSATPVPALAVAPSGAPAPLSVPDGVEGARDRAPALAPSVETRGPLVPLVPLDEVHPSTVESAVREQRIPNDQINGVFEDADGVKRDALGHPFA